MHALNLPPFDYQIKSKAKDPYIFDIIRKTYVRLTPEEWIRQHFVHYMVHHLSYPKALIQIEKGISYNERQHRPDIVAYNSQGEVLMLVECKAPYINFSADVYHQLARYNRHFKAQFLVVTNGKMHRSWQCQAATNTYALLDNIPYFKSDGHG